MAYSLSTHFAGQGLLDSFNFFTGEDPTNGFVNYQSREEALANNLVSVDEFHRVKLGVDSINTYSASDKGRPSVRITSNDAFTHGLFIADFAHMPGSTCGTWPTFWAFNDQESGSSMPTGGELNIIEGANAAQRNLFSGHTAPGCQVSMAGFAGTQGPNDCSLTSGNMGCSFAAHPSDTTTYGDAFNAEGGGVYALEWDSNDIKIWHFPRSAIPDDIRLAPVVRPEPSTWGPPQALFGGSSCWPDSYFFNMSLVINTNFCGSYAGNNWETSDQCNTLAPTCEEFVAANPSSFINSFWEINYIDIYQRTTASNGTYTRPSSGNGIMSSPPFPSTTRLASPNNNTVIPSGTRTITVSTVTRVISTIEPTRTDAGLDDPAAIKEWALLGCFDSPMSSQSFSKMASSGTMDIETCLASCARQRYAGISGETCHCADMLGHATAIANEMCDVPCPGNSGQLCGGAASPSRFINTGIFPTNSSTLAKAGNMSSTPPMRAALSSVRLTVYGKLDNDMPPGAPGKGNVVVEAGTNTTRWDMHMTAAASAVATGTGWTPAMYTGSYPCATTFVPVRATGTVPVSEAAGIFGTLPDSLGLWVVVLVIGIML